MGLSSESDLSCFFPAISVPARIFWSSIDDVSRKALRRDDPAGATPGARQPQLSAVRKVARFPRLCRRKGNDRRRRTAQGIFDRRRRLRPRPELQCRRRPACPRPCRQVAQAAQDLLRHRRRRREVADHHSEGNLCAGVSPRACRRRRHSFGPKGKERRPLVFRAPRSLAAGSLLFSLGGTQRVAAAPLRPPALARNDA
ncbi:hypothetical protein EHS39_27040 [Ensifer sp. MPMI2T]|nr:hypothetical protein EHS39_27040 [Ensifer sp. MPMI2T]